MRRPSLPTISYTGLILITAIVYGFTLAPSVVEIDAGELAAVQITLGIAHPSGYPLFTLLGYVFSRLHILRPIEQLNFLSLLFCTASLVFVCLTLNQVFESHPSKLKNHHSRHSTRNRKSPQEKDRPAEKTPIAPYRIEPDFMNVIAICIGLGFLAFSRTIWKQSTSVEVYPLHLFLISASLFFFIRAFFRPEPTIKDWLWGTIFLALGFTNHMTTLLLIPGLAYLYFQKERFKTNTFKKMAVLAGVFFAIIALVTLYLPLRAAADPTFNWGNPRNFENLIRHVSGKQYRVWLFASTEVTGRNLSRFISGLPAEFTWIGLILGLVGLFTSLNIAAPVGLFFLFCFLSTVLYSINYDIHDLDAYFLLAYLMVGIWISLGVRSLMDVFRRFRHKPLWIILMCALPISEAVNHYPEADRSDCRIYESYTRQALQSLPEGSLLLTYQWDYLVSPAYYLQTVEDLRSDITIVDKELLRRSWYFHQMETTAPDIVRPIQPEIRAFLQALEPFEKGGDFNATLLENLYKRLMSRLIETNMGERAVFIAPELVQGELRRGEFVLPTGVTLIPHLFFFQAVASDEYIPLEMMDVNLPFPTRRDRYTELIKDFVSRMLIWRALYELRFERLKEARILKKTFEAHFPNLSLPETLENL